MEEERMRSDEWTEEERSTEAEKKRKVEHDDDEEEGSPPPGFRTIQTLTTEPLVSPVELAIEKEQRTDKWDEEDSQRPPLGYQFPTQPAMTTPTILNVGKSMVLEELPSPQTMQPLPRNDVGRMTLQSPAQVPNLTALSNHPPGYQFPQPPEVPPGPVPESGTTSPLMKPPPQPQAPATQSMMPRQPAVPRPHPQYRPPPPAPTYEMAQMVCGSCHRLLSYIRGARYVQCSCCQTVNYVLEEHQVGQVKCSSCSLLLMYPHGAPSVKCSSCYSVTEIGEHNKRPPWSVQQGRAPPPCSTVR